MLLPPGIPHTFLSPADQWCPLQQPLVLALRCGSGSKHTVSVENFRIGGIALWSSEIKRKGTEVVDACAARLSKGWLRLGDVPLVKGVSCPMVLLVGVGAYGERGALFFFGVGAERVWCLWWRQE
jgi:hypothetical protein